jgi:L-lactate dehydrogenase complex protein LldE
LPRTIALLPTCVVDTVSPQVGEAAVRVLRRLGYTVSVPARATCCGQPAWNAGFAGESALVARTTLDALDSDPADAICVPAGSCATMIRVFWPELFDVVGDHGSTDRARRLAPRVLEFSELCAQTPERIDGTFPRRVAYHHSCHMLRELGIREQPLSLLERLDGCEVAPWKGDDRCCGFGGLFSVKQPETSVAMADDKIDTLAATDARLVVGCDQTCLLQLGGRMERRGTQAGTRHLAEVLDEAMTRV